MDPGTCIRYLDWAIIILAAIYLLCLAVPVVVKEVIAFGKVSQALPEDTL